MDPGAILVAVMRTTAENLIIGRGTLLFFSSSMWRPPGIFISVFVAAIGCFLTWNASLSGLLRRVKKRYVTYFKLLDVHLFASVFITLVGRLVRLLFLKPVCLTFRAQMVVLEQIGLQLDRAFVHGVSHNTLIDDLLLNTLADPLRLLKHPLIATVQLVLILSELLVQSHV